MYESNCPSGFVSIFDLLYFPHDKEANRSRNKSTEIRLMARNGLCRRVITTDQPVTLRVVASGNDSVTLTVTDSKCPKHCLKRSFVKL